MLILILTTFAWSRAGAIPISDSPGPATVPTVIHTLIFGIQARNGCSDMRSMYEILRSCLFTIAACVYRAVHPNIPDPNASYGKRLRLMMKIVICALMAPELMIYWAMRQRFGANIVVERVKELRPELRWTQAHGHFVQMGGFGRKDTKQVIYPPTLLDLLEKGQIDVEDLQLTEKEINDKSKGDILSKGLVAFQTTWFVFECLARLQQGLPIIELEVVTLAFATLNVITYGLWWYKPLNVLCPIYIPIHPKSSHPRPNPSSNPRTTSDTPPQEDDNSQLTSMEEEPLIVGGRVQPSQVEVDSILTQIGDAVKAVVDDIKYSVGEKGWWWTANSYLIVEPFYAVFAPLWQLLSDDEVCENETHVSVFYGMKITEGKENLATLSSSVIGMTFGGIHFLSWNSTFPTHAQRILWRISSIVMVTQPLLILLADLLYMIHRRSVEGSRRRSVTGFLAMYIGGVAITGGTVPYVLARFVVLVLAFLTLRDLPLGAFTNVSWTVYIPHF